MAFWRDPTVQKVENRATGVLSDFEKFILRGNVVDLAVGIIIGAAFNSVVQALVSDVITPLIPGNGKVSLSTLALKVFYTGGSIQLGTFINAIIAFLLIAAVVFFLVVKPVNALMELHRPKVAEAPTTRECPFCLSTIPLKATRCAYCTSQLLPVEQTQAPQQ